MNNAYLIFSGLILGVILYQTVFVAPTVFKTIDNVNTSKFLRKIFPKIFYVYFDYRYFGIDRFNLQF